MSSGVGTAALFSLVLSLLGTSVSYGAESFTNQRQMGLKYSSLGQINAQNVQNLELAWDYRTGEVHSESKKVLEAFEDEPSLIEGNLVVCTPTRRLIALDPATGKQRWLFDPK